MKITANKVLGKADIVIVKFSEKRSYVTSVRTCYRANISELLEGIIAASSELCERVRMVNTVDSQ